MGLIARQAEAAGIPTLSMSSARDITAAVNPPRAVFVDWPLGHTSGRANDPATNARLMRATLSAFEEIAEPGTIVDIDLPWADNDGWKDRVMRPAPPYAGHPQHADDRGERHPTPQFQTDDDETAAGALHEGRDCLVCAGIDY